MSRCTWIVSASIFVSLASNLSGQEKASPSDPPLPPSFIRSIGTSSPVHPRRFGLASHRVESIRGWYIWKKWHPDTWEAEVTKDPPGEVYRVRVLPWLTTYRHFVYGARPDDLLPGERVNLFFAADDRHPRGYLVHFQDELCQMKGHGHIWEVIDTTRDGTGFTARVMAGKKPLDGQECRFRFDPKCKAWRDGKAGPPSLRRGDRVYLTWCLRDAKRVVHLVADDTSLDAVKKIQQNHVDKEVAREGIAGQVERVEGKTVRFMAYPTYWPQAGRLKPGQHVRLSRVGKGYRPIGDAIAGKVVSQKNQGSYGSGVNDVVLELDQASDSRAVAAWAGGSVVRLIPMLVKEQKDAKGKR